MMLERGFLATNAFYASYAHQAAHVDEYAGAVGEVFHSIAKGLDAGNIETQLKGPVAHGGFYRLT